MFQNKNLVNLIAELLGFQKSSSSNKVEVEYNCPKCDNNNNKFNLVVNVKKMAFHCWACGYKGTTRQIAHDYGDGEQQERMSKISGGIFIPNKEVVEKIDMGEFRSMKFSWNDSIHYLSAKKYLASRKIDQKMVERWDICYAETGKYANRIIIPSKDTSGRVQYFIARSFYGERQSYMNPEIEKSHFIFGESFIDWKKPLFITEGVFDAMVLYNAVPILGSNISHNRKLLNKIHEHKPRIILAMDEDAYGTSMVRVAKYLRNLGVDVYIMKHLCYNDLSEAFEKEGRSHIIKMIRGAKRFDELDIALEGLVN
jgi:DNA primase